MGSQTSGGYEESVFFRNESPDGLPMANGHSYTHMHTTASTGPRISEVQNRRRYELEESMRGGHGSKWRREKADITKIHYAHVWNSFKKTKRKTKGKKDVKREVKEQLPES